MQDAPDPAYCCGSGSTCSFVNEWYWQCVPTSGGADNSNHRSSASASSTVSVSSNDSLGLWDQCGGMGGSCEAFGCVDAPFAGASCPASAGCVRLSEWWYQCQPDQHHQGGSSYQPVASSSGSGESVLPGLGCRLRCCFTCLGRKTILQR
jgi:hypothetical protein